MALGQKWVRGVIMGERVGKKIFKNSKRSRKNLPKIKAGPNVCPKLLTKFGGPVTRRRFAASSQSQSGPQTLRPFHDTVSRAEGA